MGRNAKPWQRAGRPGWWTKIGGRFIQLGETEQRAWIELARLKAVKGEGMAPRARLTVPDLVDMWLEDVQGRVKPNTWTQYKIRGQDMARSHKGVMAENWRPYHVDAWLKRHPGWGDSSRGFAIAVAKMVSRWAKHKGWCDADHLREMRGKQIKARPPAAPEDLAKLVEHAQADEHLRPIVNFMMGTGARPGEARALTAARIEWETSTAVVDGKEGERRIWIPAHVLDELRPLAAAHPIGAIFRTSRYEPWSLKGLGNAFHRIRDKLGLGTVVPYHCRGSFASRAIASGVDSALVAKMLGHRDLVMLNRHYHNPEDATLRAAVEKVEPPVNPG